MSYLLNQIIANSHIAFGTSGARGLVEDFSDTVCGAFAQSFVTVMQASFSFKRIAIGIDNRPSSERMAAACVGAIQALGYEVDYYGVLPTPALAYQALQDSVPAVMITGSHIPFDRNGLKFYRPDGEINKADEQAILAVAASLARFAPVLPAVNPAATNNYINRYLDIYPADLLQGKRIGIYEHSSAGRDLYHKVFSRLGAEVISLERTDTFVPIDTEAVSAEDRAKGQAWAQAYGLDMIFSTDGDGDRPLIADENGNWLRGDIVGLLCAKALRVEAIAVPVSCNTAIEQAGIFSKVVRTKIGSPYVIAAFNELRNFDRIAGFEANGGFMLGSKIVLNNSALHALPTRDALLPALTIMSSAAEISLSIMLNNLPQRFTASDRLQNVAVDRAKTFIATLLYDPSELLREFGLHCRVQEIDTTDGVRLILSNNDIIHLRPSGNAPEFRIYAESDSVDTSENLVQKVKMSLDLKLKQDG
jgi:phosphomannomutase